MMGLNGGDKKEEEPIKLEPIENYQY